MTNWSCLLLICGACGTAPSTSGDDVMSPPDAPAGDRSPLERCLQDGGSLHELWSVANQHGPVTSIVAGSLVVVGGEDGSVKQWSVEGDEPAYGTPFTTAGAPVGAVALSTDGNVLAATRQGEVAEWRLADAMPARTTTITDAELSALAVSGDGAVAIAGTATGQLIAIDRASGTTSQLTSTLWGAWSVAFAAGNRLYTAGHFYGTPQIERRAADAPADAVDVWNDHARNAHVRAIAIDGEATRLVAAGDGFVATFAADELAAGPRALGELAEHQAVGVVLLTGGTLFVTAGSEGTLRVWNAETAALLATLSIAAPSGIAADTAGTRLYTSGPDGLLHAFGCD